MELELHRQRRNLIGVSLALLVFELAGGGVKEISFFNGGVSLANPELIIHLFYLGLVYLVWRYWLYAKEQHDGLQKLVNDTLICDPSYRTYIETCVEDFKEESNIANMEAFQENAIEDGEAEFIPIPAEIEVKGLVFNRKLNLRVDNPKGEFNPDHKTYSVPRFEYELMRTKAWIKVISTNKLFSDLYTPYLLVVFAFGALLRRTICA